mgnify:CR=1 FL=1
MQIIFGLSAHFLAAKTSPPYMHTAKRKKRSFTGNSARTSAHFSVMFFRKTRKMSADVQAYFKRNLTPYSGNSARNLNTFFGDVFSQDKASKPPLYMHTARRKKRSFTGNSARNHSSFFGDVFFARQGARNEVLWETPPEPQLIFRRCFFRKTRKMSDGVLSVLRAKFDAVLRKNSPKNQISIMSASFFFAISSISLTYLSVIF